MVMAFMGEEEGKKVLDKRAMDTAKRKRMRRMIKRRKFNKGEL